MRTGIHDIFISYRRDGGSGEARLIRGALTERGLSVFLDVTDLRYGHFDTTILDRIAESSIFVLILSPHALDRCHDGQDWLRQEVRQALATNKQIIPVMLPGFAFPPSLPSDIEELPRHQGIDYSHTLFDATIAKLLDSIDSGSRRTLKPKMAFRALGRRLSAVGAAPLVLLVALPLGAYALFSYAVRSTIPKMIGDYGVELRADDWSVHPFSLSAVARNVTLRPPHDTAATPPFSGDEVQFSGTLGSIVAGLGKDVFHLATFGWIGAGQPFTEVDIRRGELYLELSLTGRLNWADFWDAVPQARKDQIRAGVFPVEAVLIDRLKITYIEQIPGHSGGGVIQTSQATINFDDVTGSITGLTKRGSPDEQSGTFKLTGRSADGVIAVSGTAALAGSASEGKDVRAPDVTRFPYFPANISLVLENIGAGAFSSMIPDATGIVATRGSLRGTIALEVASNRHQCISNVLMEGVHLAPNPRVIVAKENFDRLQNDLANWKTSGTFDACKPFEELSDRPSGQLSGSQNRAVAPILLAAFNTQAAATAPPSVRAAVARDQLNLGVAVSGAIDSLTNSLKQKISSAFGPTASPPRQGGNGIGKKLKRFFGGGGNDKSANQKTTTKQ